MLFRAQIPLALTSLVPAVDKRLLVIFECHAGYLGMPCNSGAIVIAGEDAVARESARCGRYGVILRDSGPTPDQVAQVVLSLGDRDDIDLGDEIDIRELTSPPPRQSDSRLKPTTSRAPSSDPGGLDDPPEQIGTASVDRFVPEKTGLRQIGDTLHLPALVLSDLSESMASEVMEIFNRLGAAADLIPMAPTTLPSVRGGRLIAFDDAIPGLRKTTLPPLDEIRSLFGERAIRGLIGGATPGYRDYAFPCSCGRRTRTAVRLLADTSMQGIRLGAAVAQICTHCGTGSLYRM
jgi:hypothetical protein